MPPKDNAETQPTATGRCTAVYQLFLRLSLSVCLSLPLYLLYIIMSVNPLCTFPYICLAVCICACVPLCVLVCLYVICMSVTGFVSVSSSIFLWLSPNICKFLCFFSLFPPSPLLVSRRVSMHIYFQLCFHGPTHHNK